ncbi:hypothetical protein BU17DRAFT_86098 [Hysterangium stoloniferum]|nr:hypothetical protein BU17DRAFT_86098 [Hysterangium stoloniferum]
MYDFEASSSDTPKTEKPGATMGWDRGCPVGTRSESSRNGHFLASAPELVSQEPHSAFLHSHLTSQSTSTYVTVPPNARLFQDTLPTVGSALFTPLLDQTSESESARFRADWKRWIAPLTQLQTLVKKSSNTDWSWRHPPCLLDSRLLSAVEEAKLKNYFLIRYSQWLPPVTLGQDGNLDKVSPFLLAVIYATAARSFDDITQSTLDCLRSLALHHVGQVFANPFAYPLTESLYALLILIVWPLDPTDDMAFLVQGAKKMASSSKSGGMPSITNGRREHLENIDHIRLWHAICANETISLALGAGEVVTYPAIDDFMHTLGTASQIASKNGNTSDVLLALEIELLKIITAAMRGRSFSPDQYTTEIKNVKDPIYDYMRTVSNFLTKLTEWEIKFYSISGECNPPEAVYYAGLEIKYHYLSIMFVVHATVMLSYICPMSVAPEDIRFDVWSWCLTINRSSLVIIRIFNKYSFPDYLAPLAEAPDCLFAMVVIAIMLLLRYQVVVAEYSRRWGYSEVPLGGFTRQAENMIRRVVGHMRRPGANHAKATSHPATRYAIILEILLRCWDENRLKNAANLPPGGVYEDELGSRNRAGDFRAASVNTHENCPLGRADQDGAGAAQLDMDLNLLGGDMFSNAAAAFTWEGTGMFNWRTTGQ